MGNIIFPIILLWVRINIASRRAEYFRINSIAMVVLSFCRNYFAANFNKLALRCDFAKPNFRKFASRALACICNFRCIWAVNPGDKFLVF